MSEFDRNLIDQLLKLLLGKSLASIRNTINYFGKFVKAVASLNHDIMIVLRTAPLNKICIVFEGTATALFCVAAKLPPVN